MVIKRFSCAGVVWFDSDPECVELNLAACSEEQAKTMWRKYMVDTCGYVIDRKIICVEL